MKRGYLLLALLALTVLAKGQIRTDSLIKAAYALPNDTNKVIALNNLAFTYYNIYPDSSKIFSTDALRIAKMIRYKRGEALSYIRLGVTFYINGNTATAIGLYEKSIVTADSIQDFNILGRAYGNIALALDDLGNDLLALEYHEEAKKAYHKIGAIGMEANEDMNLGVLHRKRNNLEEAQNSFLRSLTVDNTALPYYGLLLAEFAELRIKQERYREADSILNIGWHYLADSKNNNHRGVLQLKYAKYYLAINKADLAQTHALQALNFLEKGRYLKLIEETYGILSKIEKLRKNNDKAFTYLELHNRYQDSRLSTIAKDRAQLFEMKNIEKMKLLQEKELRLQQVSRENQQNIFFGSLTVAILIVGMLVFSIQQKKKANKKLQQVNEKVTLMFGDLQIKDDALQAVNEELKQQQEEIEAQYDAIAVKNNELQKANELVAVQNEKINLENENLDKAVKERTKELVDYNQQLEQYAFVTAHNLRGPVARILGLGNVLGLDSNDPHERQEVIDRMVQSAQELDVVIRELNEILEVKKNNTDTYIELNFSEELEKVKGSLRSEIERTQATITEDFACPTLYSIKPYIDSILYNLISNAIKYRHSDRLPSIHIKTTLEENSIVLSISDNGIGFESETNKDKLYHLYARFHTHVEGRGIGLFLVKTQVLALNGKIMVDSKVNEGTEFIISFRV